MGLKNAMIFAIINIFVQSKIFSSDSCYIYCVSSDQKWYWLYNNKLEYVKISGSWHKWILNENNMVHTFSYFIPDNPLEAAQNLTLQCQHTFGNKFYLPQPADDKNNNWNIFAKDENTFFSGFIDIFHYRKKINNFKDLLIINNYFRITHKLFDAQIDKMEIIRLDSIVEIIKEKSTINEDEYLFRVTRESSF